MRAFSRKTGVIVSDNNIFDPNAAAADGAVPPPPPPGYEPPQTEAFFVEETGPEGQFAAEGYAASAPVPPGPPTPAGQPYVPPASAGGYPQTPPAYQQPPAAGYPQAPAGGYQQPPAAGYQQPGQYAAPYGAAAPVGPNAFGEACKAIWYAPAKIWKSKPLEALDIGVGVGEKTGNSWILWLITFLLNSFLGAVAITATWAWGVTKAVGLASGWASDLLGIDMGYYWSLNFGDIFLVFLLYFLLIVGALFLRAVTLFWTQRTCGVRVSFGQVLTSYATSQTLFSLPLAVVALLGLATLNIYLLPFIAIFWAGLLLMADLFNYVATLRPGGHRTYPLVSYAWFTVAWGVMTMLLFFILSLIFY